jgi:hypothetical protein
MSVSILCHFIAILIDFDRENDDQQWDFGLYRGWAPNPRHGDVKFSRRQSNFEHQKLGFNI